MNPFKTAAILLTGLLFAIPAAAKPGREAGPKKTEAPAAAARAGSEASNAGKAKATEAKARAAAKAADAKANGKANGALRKAKAGEGPTTKNRDAAERAAKRPMSSALLQETRRHASRSARLLRIRAIAEEKGDAAAVSRADALLAKEDARHDRWMKVYAARTTP